MKIMMVSGGFDPIHKGHVRMLQAAKEFVGTTGLVVVGVNSDEWLTRKKGKPFMKQGERMELVSGLGCVDVVMKFDDSDDTACDFLKKVQKSFEDSSYCEYYFGNGGDRTDGTNTPEYPFCEQNGIEMIFQLGGGKIQSSSGLIANASTTKKDNVLDY